MKWVGTYLIGFALLIVGLLAALWKLNVLQSVDPMWIAIGLLIAFGAGVMAAVSASGRKESIEIDQHR